MERERMVEVGVALLVVVCILLIVVCYATYERRPTVPVDRYPWDDTPTPVPIADAPGVAPASVAPVPPPIATAAGG